MTYEEFMTTIEKSVREDWIHFDNEGVWTYKKDLMIHFKEKRNENEAQAERAFHEPWVLHFADKKAWRITFAIYYGTSLVEEVSAASVDGHRTIIPFPKSPNDLVISQWQYRFGKILDQDPSGAYSFDRQIEQAGIRVE